MNSFDPANIDILMDVRNRPTITDVARLCGVTPATVSRVLNGKQKFSASEAVRQKILETARKLGYVPDLAARNLNRRALLGSVPIMGPLATSGCLPRHALPSNSRYDCCWGRVAPRRQVARPNST